MEMQPIRFYGLYVPLSCEDYFISRYNNENNTIYTTFQDLTQDMYELEGTEIFYAEYETDCAMEIIGNKGTISYLDKNVIDGSLVVSLPKQPRLFQPAYKTLEDCVKEMRKLVGKYLPEDFPYETSIGEFSCVCFC